MEKVVSSVVMIVFSLAIGIAGAYANRQNVIQMPRSSSSNHGPILIKRPKPVEQWFESLGSARETRAKIHFYFQDVLMGDNKTVWKVAEAEITAASPTTFGQLSMIDDLLTKGPESDSGVVGRAQGTIGFADLNSTAIHMNLNIIFTTGKYKGSTISISGRNPIFETDRELAIVGGTGIFRMARGIAVSNTYSFDAVKNYGILEYTLYVTYYA